MPQNSFSKYFERSDIIKIPKQKCKIIQGTKLQNGRVYKKEMIFVKYNENIGFVKLDNGQHMDLTENQLYVFERLIEAAENERIYVHISQLQKTFRGDSKSCCKIFQHHDNWRDFIELANPGLYRLKLYADEYKLKYNIALQRIKKQKATGELLRKNGERFH
ncbi:MAG: hypothetical protein LBF37_00455 [Rickettsiales bacterium]|jgi:hypothetical protein|nr:hypothetical protein [Rickettsiales bacterium]